MKPQHRLSFELIPRAALEHEFHHIIYSTAGQVKVLVTQSCLIVCDPMDCSLPGSSVQGILQARILERIVIPFSRGSSQPRDRTQVSCIAGRFFTSWATRLLFFFTHQISLGFFQVVVWSKSPFLFITLYRPCMNAMQIPSPPLIHPVKDIWFISSLGQLQIDLLSMFMYGFLCGHTFSFL